ncbi:hypothetical protein F5B20DRAFT_303604 [Whalleya microplaca]|nr:hypothetical protein F5B20DRAFT_303604 [Whalleya microplaca]
MPVWMRRLLQEAPGCPEVIAAGGPGTAGLGSRLAADLGRRQDSAARRCSDADQVEGGVLSDGEADPRPLWDAPTNVGLVAGQGWARVPRGRLFGQYGVQVWNATVMRVGERPHA